MQLQTAEFKLIEIINFFAPGLSLAKWFGNDSKQRKQMKPFKLFRNTTKTFKCNKKGGSTWVLEPISNKKNANEEQSRG